MRYINLIFGITTDDRAITIDGFKVESYMTYVNDYGEDCIEINFKSGSSVNLISSFDEYPNDESIEEKLMECMDVDASIITKPFGPERIQCNLPDGKEFNFDGNAVEYYYDFHEIDEVYCVELHFASGKVVTVKDEVDQEIYPQETIMSLVDTCICRYLKEFDDEKEDEE